LAPSTKHFVPLKTLYYLYNSLAPQTMPLEPEPKFQAPTPPSKVFGSASSHPKLLGLRIQSPANNVTEIFVPTSGRAGFRLTARPCFRRITTLTPYLKIIKARNLLCKHEWD